MPRKAPTALILIAAQFDELAVVTCLAALRQRGMAAALVGLGPGPVRSAHGVVLQPDASLAEGAALAAARPRLLILAGGVEATARALLDPRTHRLARQVAAAGGRIAAPAAARALLAETGLLAETAVTFWEPGETAVF